MARSLTALWLFSHFICPVLMSVSIIEDDDGSGYDLDKYLSGNWSEHDGVTASRPLDSRHTIKAGSGHKRTFEDSVHPTSDGSLWLVKDSEFVFLAESKGFLENTEICAAVVSGGVVGVALAVALAGMLIYKQQRQDNGGYSGPAGGLI